MDANNYKIIGACFEVYNQKGYGFIEPVYQECLQIEFAMQNIPFVSQPEIQMSYKGTLLNQYFKPDFICYGKIIVEIKSVATILAAHRAQAINYLKATELNSRFSSILADIRNSTTNGSRKVKR
jgi:GxxExxY protein